MSTFILSALDAVLSGRDWEVQERYDSASVPAHPVRVQKTACYTILAVLLNHQMKGSLYYSTDTPQGWWLFSHKIY
uniref:Uncharacterized protein n=1 Tax=Chelydra serpentina TaxID=8475 RepID=A0A8C3TIK6_CHESE